MSARQRALLERLRAESVGGPVFFARVERVAYEVDGEVVVATYADAVAALRRLCDRGLAREGPKFWFRALAIGERRPAGLLQ